MSRGARENPEEFAEDLARRATSLGADSLVACGKCGRAWVPADMSDEAVGTFLSGGGLPCGHSPKGAP